MSQYVYALHDFDPENPDEVPFRAGERIEVIERDEEFGDGWWQGRNLSGKTGLFPVSYTTPAPPSNDVASSQSLPHIQEPDHEQQHEPTFERQNSYDSATGLRSPTALEAIHEHDETTANNSPSPHLLSPQPVQAAPEPQRFDSDASLYPESLRERLHDEHAEEAQPSPEIPDSQSTAGRSVMRATLTDVQQAIEQLGRRGTFMDDGGRSFSFASSRSVTSETEDDHDDDDDGFGTEYGDDDDQGWHKDARTKLAEKARRAAAKEQKEREREKARATLGNGGGLSLAPPIEVELSDESEPEEGEDDTRHPAGPPGSGYHAGSAFLPRNPTISEEGPLRAESPTELVEPGTARANQATFESMPSLYPHPEDPRARRVSQIYPEAEEEELQGPPTPVSPPAALPVAEPAPRPVTELIFVPVPKTSPTSPAEPVPPVVQIPKTPEPPKPAPLADIQARNVAQAFPSPVSSAFQSTKPAPPLSPAPFIAPITPPPPTSNNSQPGSAGGGDASSSRTHPSEWTVDQVVEWLRSKGFDDSVCNTFIEQEVTGDVLLEIDQAVLKTEFGIAAFGKRVRIANAISDLKRPASFSYSDAGQAFPGIGQQQQQSQQQQHLGRPDPINVPGPGVGQMGAMATPVSHHSSGMQSLRSESPGPSGMRAAPSMAPTDMGSLIPQSATTSAGGGATHFHRRNMSDVSGSVASSVRWMDGSTVGTTVEGQATSEGGYGGIGLGLAPTQKMGLAPPGRANQLAASPSEGALSQRALGEASIAEEAEDGRAALSESEAAPKEKSKRRQFFGRSLESTMEKDKESIADGAPSPRSAKSASARSDGGAAAATETGSVRSRHSKKRSIDVEKKDRLSIFGGISGIGGKARKPAPRYSAALDNADIPGNNGTPEKQHSNRLLSSLYPSSTSKRSVSARPSTANSTTKDSPSNSPVDARTAYADSAPRGRDPALLRKRTASQNEVPRAGPDNEGLLSSDAGPGNALKPGQSILEQIGTPDHEGWMRKKSERYNSWKVRFFVLKGPHLYVMKSNSRAETKIKGYMHIAGYKVVADENIDPGRYGFRLVHEQDKEHYFSSEEKGIVREWMKALIKATITRDYQKPVISSVNIPTIPLTVAQTMNPAPRPPSPGARDATQRATRRDNPNQLSTRDAQILMGIPGQDKNGAIVPPQGDRRTLPAAFREETAMQSPSNSAYGSMPPSRSAPTPLSPRPSVSGPAPPRPSREQRRLSSSQNANPAMLDMGLVEWANPYLPQHLRINSLNDGVYGGLALLRLAEAIKGKPASPPVPDSAFPANPSDEKLDGLFQLFDYLLDNDVKVGAVSINDIRQGRRDKVIQILRALKQWEDKRRAIAMGISQASPVGYAGPMMAGGGWGGGGM